MSTGADELVDGDPFGIEPEPEPEPSTIQLRTILDCYIVLAHSHMERVKTRKEASAVISAVTKEVRDVRGSMVPKDRFYDLVFGIARKYYGVR